MTHNRRVLRRILLAVVLLVCLAVVWCRKSPDNTGKIGERNGDATMAMDENSTSKLCTKLTSAANVVVTRPPQTIKPAWDVRSVPQSLPLSAASAISKFAERQTNSSIAAAQQASDMNDVMDEMLNRSEIPADYAETMVALFRDKSRGDVIRDFAVQHIGLYAETLNKDEP